MLLLSGEPEDFTPAFETLLQHAREIAEAIRLGPPGQCIRAEARVDRTWHGTQVVTQEERDEPDQPLVLDSVVMYWTTDPAIAPIAVEERIRALARGDSA